jgi:hypothetical protein
MRQSGQAFFSNMSSGCTYQLHEGAVMNVFNKSRNVVSSFLRRLATACIGTLLFPLNVTYAQSALTSGVGSAEFTAKLHSGQVSFLKPQIIFYGVSSDGNERIETKLLADDLIVVREVRPCLRQSARIQGAVKPGIPHQVSIRWNRASASLAVDGREVVLESSLTDQLRGFGSSRISMGSTDVDVRNLVFNQLSTVAESPADRQFLAKANCFNPQAIATIGPVTEIHRGVELRGFQQQGQLDSIKRWIDAMTPEMLAAVRSVSATSEGAQTWRGLSIPNQRAMLLRPEIVSEPRIFFHEGTHLLDGLHGWRDSHDWGVQFMHLSTSAPNFSPGVMGHMDGSAPGEQLAEAVGLAKTEALSLARTRMCQREENCAEKMNFLASRGYLTKADSDALVAMKAPLQGTEISPSPPASTTDILRRAPKPNPFYKTETIIPPPGASKIDIVLESRYFRPIDIYHDGGTTVPPTWRGCKAEDIMNRLTTTKPSAIISEPLLKGGVRKYGYFDFGIKKNRRHYLAMDGMADGSIQMHFDMKGNGRLDDTLPKMGQFKDGEKAFATLIEFPWSELMDNAPFDGHFKLWFISNTFEWAISGFSKSSRTQLLGAIQLNDQMYDLIIADTAFSDNDGDLTNDGICLRKPAQKAICWKDAEVKAGVDIDGRRYTFNVRLPAAAR